MDHIANMVREAASALTQEIERNGLTEKADALWRTMLSGWRIKRRPDVPILEAAFFGVDLADGPDRSVEIRLCRCGKLPGLHPVHED